ncbi:hypothetical protein BD414DRAFT_485771 [Trametes punicea]|nr:hypothetical protein BD414DRAFT_485771 [Trametes punicea]
MPRRSTRSMTAVKAKPSSGLPAKSKFWPKGAKAAEDIGEEGSDVETRGIGDIPDDSHDASDVESLDSDALDEDDFEPSGSPAKRKRTAATGKQSPGKKNTVKKASPRKGKVTALKKRKVMNDENSDGEELELEDGQEVVGTVVQAPKTGRVPPGRISRNTLNFLSELKKPECNDREWYAALKPVYRLAESEWKAFIESFTDLLVEADPQIPHLPPKDVIHRIYRDIRFSNDKTPYKTGFSASFSRSGRKGIFAGCSEVKPGGESLIAAGSWCPGKNELQTIRNNLLRSSRRLRRIISAPEFEALFGPARPHPKGARQNIFGFEDELKVAPKGIDKTHKDIDLLKCRSFAVVHKFTDQEVLSPHFKEELARVARVVRPFVHCLNDLMTIQDPNSSDSDSDGADEDDPSIEDAGEM